MLGMKVGGIKGFSSPISHVDSVAGREDWRDWPSSWVESRNLALVSGMSSMQNRVRWYCLGPGVQIGMFLSKKNNVTSLATYARTSGFEHEFGRYGCYE